MIALTLEEQVLVTLEYWREYRTYFHMGTNWGVSESTICRIVTNIESTLMKTGKFRIPGKKALLKPTFRRCGSDFFISCENLEAKQFWAEIMQC